MATVKGNYEILIGTGPNPDNDSVPGEAISPDLAPVILGALKGYTNFQAGDPVTVGERTALASWTAETKDAQTVRINLWPEPPDEPNLDALTT